MYKLVSIQSSFPKTSHERDISIYQTLVIILIPSACISTTRISYKSTLLVGEKYATLGLPSKLKEGWGSVHGNQPCSAGSGSAN